ncbi:protein of unknown function [Taphrina deformans PYCC 5710]|uniref:BZIP domain-containing protein n=1 Tax=Taphrina deformans (strain PYCC 5710 / ATCC 11124 / CBS 356.35 / IMI 108563 / JCM 9778 / NBRC 8474) TaxID=1097556 RepID=R4XGT2_TAPDE|nr:protein of unknown function [Taphrina deformans PYCC 5710]|eukprot:CCG84879.1 protein of unknown function [Taphrina deformans PYCC 5710]
MTTNPPSIAMKPASAANSSAFAVQTSKEWVLPPRPKPGRKADCDNAPTKRKAQNREAQRAFRERRAARVGELEQQIRDIEAGHRTALEALEVDNGRLKLENIKLRDALDGLMRELSTIRSLTKLSESPSHNMQTPNLTPNASLPITAFQQVASPAASLELEAIPELQSVTPGLSPLNFPSLSPGLLGQSVPLRRKHKSTADAQSINKKPRLSQNSSLDPQEMDYAFSIAAFKPPAGESCGFCSDGTPCLCAEAAQQHAMTISKHDEQEMEMEREMEICGLCAQEVPCGCTAGANEADTTKEPSTTATTVGHSLPVIPEEDNGLCTGNPGSCRQCQLDPMSTLFCRTLAASNTGGTTPPLTRPPALLRNSSTFSTSSARDSTPPPTTEVQGFVPCSAAYKTLSRHENFRESDMDSIVRGLDVDRASGRGVAVGSVRHVLRILDRGLGRGS